MQFEFGVVLYQGNERLVFTAFAVNEEEAVKKVKKNMVEIYDYDRKTVNTLKVVNVYLT